MSFYYCLKLTNKSCYFRARYNLKGKFELSVSEDGKPWELLNTDGEYRLKKGTVYYYDHKRRVYFHNDGSKIELTHWVDSQKNIVLDEIPSEDLPSHLQETCCSELCLNMDLTLLGYCLEVVGSLVFLLAMALLSGPALGVVAGLGAAAVLVGVGLFAYDVLKNDKKGTPEQISDANLAPSQ